MSDLLATWGELLDRPHLWRRWLQGRMEGLRAASCADAVLVLLLDPREGDFVPTMHPPRFDPGIRSSPPRVVCDDGDPLGKVFHGGRPGSWCGEDASTDTPLLRDFASVSAAPLRFEGTTLGIVAVGAREGEASCSCERLSGWAELLGDVFALRLASVRREAEHQRRLGLLKDMTSHAVGSVEIPDTILRYGLEDRSFQVVGLTLFDDEDGPQPAVAHALERRDEPGGQRRAVPVALPTIGSLLQHTLKAGKTVRLTPATRSLYLSDAPDLAGFMDGRGLSEGVFSPVLTEQGPAGAVLALAERDGLTDGALSRIDELAVLLRLALHYRFSLTGAIQKVDRLENELEQMGRLNDRALDLIQHVLAGHSLQEFVRMLTHLTSTPLLVEDSSFEHLSFAWPSGTPNIYFNDSERLLLSAPLRNPETRRGLQNADAVPRYLELPGAFPYAAARVVMTVVVEGEIVGYLSSLRGDLEPDAAADSRLSLAADFVGLHMIRRQTTEEVRHRLSGELINDLLSGRRDEPIMGRIRRLDYDLAPPFFVVALAWRQRSWEKTIAGPTAKMVMGLTVRVVSRQYPGALVGEKDGFVLFVLSVDDEREVTEVANRAISAVQNTFSGTIASACISGRCTQIWDMETAYAEATKVLRLFENLGGGGRAVSADHLSSYTALFQTDNLRGLHEFADRWLRPLLAYDAEKDGDLVPTLHAYLRNWGHQSKTAAECSVHVSTIKYRLQRIAEIADLDLSDPETRAQAQLACQILRTIDVLRGEGR